MYGIADASAGAGAGVGAEAGDGAGIESAGTGCALDAATLLPILFFIAETSTCIMSFTSPADLMWRVWSGHEESS